MAVEVKLPRLGQGMESGTIVRWLKSEGDAVAKGEPLYELDTDKVTQEVEAEADGVLLGIVVQGGEVDVGTTVAVIGEKGEDVSELLAAAPSGDGGVRGETRGEVAPVPQPERVTAVPSLHEPEGRLKASPLARRIARERGVDLSRILGTGPDGRIVAEDVELAAAPGAPAVPVPVPAEVEIVELTSVRKTIARRLTEAWEAPVFQLVVTADATELTALRERLVELVPEDAVRPTVGDVLTRLVAAALMRHPAVNALFVDGAIHRYPNANVGIAVATPNGLVVPVIRRAERMSIQEIAAARADLVTRARAAKLQFSDFEEGTFTISNLGMYGIDQFVAVLNPPQVAILAVGAIQERPLVVDGDLEVAPAMTMTLTCDHRAIDGSEGAEFLQTVKALVETPALAL
jgi:pyruvate dehydrogenase E2 component (dihydrolipoamide acetyltransferase)